MAMHILHVTEYCHAGTVGGTERYILDLIRGLEAAGINNTIGWLKAGNATETIESEGVKILTLPSPEMRVDSPALGFREAAERLLDSEKPDLLHFHTFGLSEAALAQLARQRDIPYAFTYHSPAWTCRRETGLLYGKEPCDGQVRAWRCSTCQSEERLKMGSLSGHAATAASLLAGWASLPLGTTSFRRRSAFFYDNLRYRQVLRNFLANCKLVISCCDWSRPVLIRNNARVESVRNCPQGVSTDFISTIQETRPEVAEGKNGNFTIGCIGRLSPVKGVHIVMEAFLKMRQPEARLRIVGWEPENANGPYASRLKKLAEADPRVTLVPKTNLAATINEYRQLALLAIPSIWMETGPLTLLEASAMGVPVYGSSRVGQIKFLRERGRVIEPGTPESWQQAMEEAFERHQQGLWGQEIDRARGNTPIRTMDVVTSEMIQNYREVPSLSQL
jgi:glycosyltransferase involved in cell wall biosynthesis